MKFEEITISHSVTLRVRYADTDKMGIVYNGTYFTYFEVGRTELMRHVGLAYTEFENAGYFLPLIEAKAEYKQPAYYDDILSIEAILKLSYSPIIRFDYNIFRDKTTIAIGHTMHSFMNALTRKPVKPPRLYYDIVLKYSESIGIAAK